MLFVYSLALCVWLFYFFIISFSFWEGEKLRCAAMRRSKQVEVEQQEIKPGQEKTLQQWQAEGSQLLAVARFGSVFIYIFFWVRLWVWGLWGSPSFSTLRLAFFLNSCLWFCITSDRQRRRRRQRPSQSEICITLSLINIFYAPFEFHSKSKFAHTPTFFPFHLPSKSKSNHSVLFLPDFRVGRRRCHFDIDRSNPSPNPNPSPEKPTRKATASASRGDWQRVKNDFESVFGSLGCRTWPAAQTLG